MLVQGSFEKARRYIEQHSAKDAHHKSEVYPCLTLSRETGAGADVISNKLVDYFNKHRKDDSPEWTIFDKNLIDKVLEDHNLPPYLDKIFEENADSAVKSLISETLTGLPSAWTLAGKTFQTILHLAKSGNVIIIGRGANFVTAKLRNSFHVRLIAAFKDRTKHIREIYQLSKKEAEQYIRKNDEARQHFVKNYFNKKIEEPLYYHLTINTSLISYGEAAKIIRREINKRPKRKLHLKLQPFSDLSDLNEY